MIDDGTVSDVEMLEKLASRAAIKAKVGPPVDDPFVTAESQIETQAPFEVPARSAPQPSGPVPKFPFEAVDAMDDKALAIGMRELLTASVRHGASDLHLSTGRRPFIRRERKLSFISEHTL